MGLTKEECQIAWNTIKDLNDYPIQCTTNETQDKFQMIPFVELFSNEIALIDSLLKQHFDNLPLKREEIHEMVSEINKHDVVIFDDEEIELLKSALKVTKWKYINNMLVMCIQLIIICISIYMCVNYSMWRILLLLLL